MAGDASVPPVLQAASLKPSARAEEAARARRVPPVLQAASLKHLGPQPAGRVRVDAFRLYCRRPH